MTALRAVGILMVAIGFGLAFGGVLGWFRYGAGLGRWTVRVFRAWMRYGTIAGIIGLALLGIASLAS